MNYKLEKNELENKVTITFSFSQEEFEQAIKNTNKEDRNQAIQEAVDSLISSSYVETVTKEDQRRIIDFLSGTVYAIGGDLQKIGVAKRQ